MSTPARPIRKQRRRTSSHVLRLTTLDSRVFLVDIFKQLDVTSLGAINACAKCFVEPTFSTTKEESDDGAEENHSVVEEVARRCVLQYPKAWRDSILRVHPERGPGTQLGLLSALKEMVCEPLFMETDDALEIERTGDFSCILKTAADATAMEDAPNTPSVTASIGGRAASKGRHYIEVKIISALAAPTSESEDEDENLDFMWDREISVTLAPPGVMKKKKAVKKKQRLRRRKRKIHSGWELPLHGYSDGGDEGVVLRHGDDEGSIWNCVGQYMYDAGELWECNDGCTCFEEHCDDGNYYYQASSIRYAPGWKRPDVGDVVGFLWNADEGHITVFVNGKRISIVNKHRWCGEIKGELCWSVELSSGSLHQALSVQVERLPPPILAGADLAAEVAELAAMKTLMEIRAKEYAVVLEEIENPTCSGCRKRWTDIPPRYEGGSNGRNNGCCGCCVYCCY